MREGVTMMNHRSGKTDSLFLFIYFIFLMWGLAMLPTVLHSRAQGFLPPQPGTTGAPPRLARNRLTKNGAGVTVSPTWETFKNPLKLWEKKNILWLHHGEGFLKTQVHAHAHTQKDKIYWFDLKKPIEKPGKEYKAVIQQSKETGTVIWKKKCPGSLAIQKNNKIVR